MKVLIVDDNVAIREIVAEILTVDGCVIRHASDLETAGKEMDDFEPDVMILDSVLGGESTLNFALSLDKDCGTKIILIMGGRESPPKDNPLIVGAIKKPFNSSELLDAVRRQREGANPEEKSSKKERSRFKFFSFGKHTTTEHTEEEDDNLIRFGKSYLVLEDEPNDVYMVAQQFAPQGCDMLVITSDRPKAVAEKIKDEHTTVVGLTQRPRDGHIEYTKLGTLMHQIMEFINENVRPVVVIDDLSRIIEYNNANLSITMVYQIVSNVDRRYSMIVSVKDSLLTEKDKNLLYKYMGPFTPYSETPKE